MDGESAAELWLEPGGLRWHDVAGVCDVNELLHGDRVEGESHCHLAAVNTSGKLSDATDASYKVYSPVGPQVLYAEQVIKDEIGEYCHIQYSDRVIVVISSWQCLQ